MGVDEEGTLAQRKAHRRDLIDPKVSQYQGRIVKTAGDGMLVEFASVVDAVRCATEIQKAMPERNARVAEDKRFHLRMAINLGDIIVEGDDIFGDGVNVAARLETLCEPGGIVLSAAAYEQVRRKQPLAYEDMGPQRLKNIAEPVHVYRIEAQAKPAPSTSLSLPETPSIAVLPFTNMSGDSEQEYFADGMVEEIITALSRFSGLLSRNWYA
jgi:adenylate cyclase